MENIRQVAGDVEPSSENSVPNLCHKYQNNFDPFMSFVVLHPQNELA